MSLDKHADAASKQAFLAWPGWQVFKTTGALSVLFTLIFYAIYGLTDHLTELHSYRVAVHFPWEPHNPMITWMSVVYVSISPLLMLAPWVIREVRRFQLMFKVMVVETVIAGVFFLVLPVQQVYPEPAPTGDFAWVFNLADTLNLNHNELPSLHVAFAFTLVYFYAADRTWLGKMLLWSWGGLLAISTMLTHQHYLLSVAAGMLLSSLVIYLLVIKPHPNSLRDEV